MKQSKILLFIVEGKSDEASLAPALEQIIDKNVKFKVIQSDITSDFKSNPKNIVNRIKSQGVKSFLNKNPQFRETDICGLIHIVDTDGVFVNDNNVLIDETVDGVLYCENKILENSKKYKSFIKSRENKRNNIEVLINLKSISLKKNYSVSYEIYYMSCNLDHVLHGNRNYSPTEKRINSEKFASEYNDSKKFIKFFNHNVIKVDSHYFNSWKYIKNDNNSLSRCSNLNICIDKYMKKELKNKMTINKDMKILVTGVKGQLGYDCVRELKSRGYTNVLGVDRSELDITDEEAVHKYINEYKPDVVMHNAAWTQVDKAEENKEAVYKVNALGPKYIAEACKEVNAKMVYISTDYVFDGKGDTPFEVDSPKNGLSTYGKTKGQGEDFVTSILDKYFIVRISWVFGINGNNFVKTMLKLADMGKTELNVVSDQIGSVTYTYDLAKLLCDMIETDKYGVYHATNEGYISWCEFACEIFKQANKNVVVHGVTTKEYKKLVPNQTDRPLNSRMSKDSLDRAGFNRLPDWKDALSRYLNELEETK